MKAELSDARTSGTQAIQRAASVLRSIAKAGEGGVGLAQVARSEGLARSTAHRILKCLVEEGLLELQGADKRYVVGHLVHELALVPAPTAVEAARWRPVVEEVARRTGATAYLMRRSGIEAVCVVKVDGQGVLRFVPVEVGQRRLLGVGAGATALLAALEPAAAEDVIRMVAPGLAPFPRLTPQSLAQSIAEARRSGFATSQGRVVEHGFGLGMSLACCGEPHLALSIAAHASFVSESSVAEWKKTLAAAVAGA